MTDDASRITPYFTSPNIRTSMPSNLHPPITRRAFLGGVTGALGTLALTDLLAAESAAAGPGGAARSPHHPARADAVICLFQHGGPSQVDLFDPKPELNKRHGQPYAG